jgi:hypothetical protein
LLTDSSPLSSARIPKINFYLGTLWSPSKPSKVPPSRQDPNRGGQNLQSVKSRVVIFPLVPVNDHISQITFLCIHDKL